MSKKLVEGFVFAIVLVLGMAMFSVASFATQSTTDANQNLVKGTVNATALMIREQPGTEYASLGKLANGTQLSISGKCGNWYKISYESIIGWVCADYVTGLSGTVAEISSTVTGTVNATSLMIREQPGTEYGMLGKLTNGTQVSILGKNGNWYKITGNGVNGWVCADYIVGLSGSVGEISTVDNVSRGGTTIRNDGKTDYASLSLGEKISAHAQKYLGVPYVAGGLGPDGFDCSGFTQTVFKEFGIDVPRGSAAYAGIGTKVTLAEAKAGDVISFKVDGISISHVGIYMGNNEFIHCSSSAGVTISSTSSTYWAPKICSVRRVV